jgi:histidinol-phosphate aminotransferase
VSNDDRAFAHLRRDLHEAQVRYVRPPEPRETALLRAHMNEMIGDWPKETKAAWLAEVAKTDLGLYPEIQGELTARLEQRLGAAQGSVLIGPSSGALLDLLALAGLNPGDTVAVPEPGFSLYPLLVRRAQALLLPVPVGSTFSLDGFRAAAEQGARQLWLTLPNNPTGAWLRPMQLAQLCAQLERAESTPLVVVDEAYAEFAPETARLLVDRFDFVVVVRTFSKALGSAGLRLGYLLAAPALTAQLAAFQLPYSVSTPSLLALRVALDSPAPFERAVDAAIERRERLVSALTDAGVTVAESSANFLYLTPDKSAELQNLGVLARALPGTATMRVSLAEESTAELTAKVYGAKLAAAPQRAHRHAPLLVLDIDGVLIDAEASFRTSVQNALRDLAPDFPWSDGLFRAMKRIPGMNNDFRLTAALLHGWRTLGPEYLTAVMGPESFTLGASESAAIEALTPTAASRVAHHYQTAWQHERPLVRAEDLAALPGTHAIYTGRNAGELALAERVLGFQLPAVVDCGAHVRKPSPGGLLQLRDAFRASSVMFIGDTRDDYAALQSAARELPHVRFGFCAVGPARHEIVPQPDSQTLLSFPTFRDAKLALCEWLTQEAP